MSHQKIGELGIYFALKGTSRGSDGPASALTEAEALNYSARYGSKEGTGVVVAKGRRCQLAHNHLDGRLCIASSPNAGWSVCSGSRTDPEDATRNREPDS